MRSIRAYLLVWLLSGVMAALLIAIGISYWKAQEDIRELLDSQLQQIAVNLRNPPAFASSEEQKHYLHEARKHQRDTVIETWDTANRLTYQSQPSTAIPRPGRPGFATLAWQGQQWRVFVQQNPDGTVLVARPLSALAAISAHTAKRILLPILALLPVLAVFIWLIVGHALRPFGQIADALRRRVPGTLSPVEIAQPPTEAQPMLRALNDLLARLNEAMQAQRQFIADAAHELRTPLAALQAQTQIVRRARSLEGAQAAAGKLEARIQRAAHLAQQLLTMSRLEPEAPTASFTPVELNALLREVLSTEAPLAQEKSIHLELLEAPPVADVRVSIVDTGPGIPAGERERVFDRFYRRAGSGVPGSGLGLAIVQRIAQRHQATISLSEGKNGVGLKVTVTLQH